MAALFSSFGELPLRNIALIFAAIAQGAFAWANREKRPELAILSPPPSATARDVLAFGDRQFLYRAWMIDLQNAGDTGGRATPMREYNYDYVLGWLSALQSLDPDSHQHTMLAARYFSQIKDQERLRRLVDFIAKDVALSPTRKWYWLTQAIEMAEAQLQDPEYALKLSRQLVTYDSPDMAGWVWFFPALYLEKLGRYNEARDAIADAVRNKRERLTPEQLRWTEFFTQGLPK